MMLSFQSLAQEYDADGYDFGVGVRGGFTSGLTFKMMMDQRTAIEGILGWGFRGVRIVGLYEIHAKAFEVDGLNWFYGVGGHVAFYNYGKSGDWRWNGFNWERNKNGENVTNSFGVGVDGILGIEYQIQEIPFTVGLDIKPAIEFNTLGFFPFMFWDSAFSIRYVW